MDRTYTDADFAEEETTYTDADFADDNTPAAQTFTDADFLPDAPQASDQISLLDAIDQNTGGMLATVKGIPSNLAAAGKMALGDVASMSVRAIEFANNPFKGLSQKPDDLAAYADEVNRATAQIEQEAAQQDVAAGRPEFFGKTARGVTRSLATAAPMGMALGPFGAIGSATLIQGSQSATEALDAGIPEGERARFVAEQMMWEGLPATLMQRIGLGGLESQLGTLANPAKRGISAALKQFGVSSLQELPEEYVTALGQAVSRVASGVGKPEEIGPDGIYNLMLDVTAQTLGTTGLVSASRYRPASQAPATPTPQPSQTSDGPPTTPQDLTLQPEPQYEQTYEQEFGDVWADLAQETPQAQPAPTPSPAEEVVPQATVAPTATPSETPEQFAERVSVADQMSDSDSAYYRENQAAVDEALRQMYDQYAEVDAVDEGTQQPAESEVIPSEEKGQKAEVLTEPQAVSTPEPPAPQQPEVTTEPAPEPALTPPPTVTPEPAPEATPSPIRFKHSGKGDTAVYEASIEGRAVTISKGKDGWEVRLDGRVKDVRPTIKAARDYAKGDLRQDLMDERNAREDTAFESAPIESPRAADRNYAAMDDATLGSVISRAQSQGDTRTMIDALNERKRRRGPAPADTGIYRDLTAAAREGKRFVEALYPRIQPVLARIHAEAKSAVDFVRRAVAKIGEHIKPYAQRFLADVRAVNKEFRQNPTRGSVPTPEMPKRGKVTGEARGAGAPKLPRGMDAAAQTRQAGVVQGYKEGVLRQQQDTRAMLDIARQVLPAKEWRAIAKAAMSISRMRNSTEAGKRRALDRVLSKHLSEIRRGQALSKTQKTIKAIKQKFNKLRPEVQDAVTDIFKGFREKNITEATYDKALSVLARGTSRKDAVTPKELARAARIIESFEGDDKPELLRNLSQQELESINDVLESLMEKNDAMNAGIVAEIERQKLANNTLAVEEVKARGPVTLKNLAFENKVFRSIGDTILNLPNIVRGIATKSGHVYKTLVSDLVEADTKTQAMLLKHSRVIQRAVAEAGITPDQIRSMSAIDNNKAEEVEVAGVKMTKGERISLLLHLSDPDTRAILMNPKSLGFKFSRAESGANRRLKITPEVAEEIENSATPEELKLARIFFDWSNGEVMNDVNEWSTRVFGYKMFRNDQHWNRRRNITDKEPAIGLQADGTQAQQEATGYLKERTGGTSYIIVDDAFQHVASHMNAIAALVGKFEASVNARRLLGTSAFQDAVAENRRTGGKILQELNKRINEWGAISNPRPEAGMRFVRWAGRNYTASKLATNFSVIISQPFSVLSAAKVIPSKYIAKTFAATPMDVNALAEIEATPEAADLYYIVHGGGQHIVTPGSMAGATMGDIFKTAEKPFTDKMMTFVERGNDMAVFNIWRAAKAWGQDQGLSGDELMRFTAKTARDAWLQTQPSHSSVYHSGIKLRSRSSPTAYALSMFQGQTAIQFQDAIDSVRDYQELPDSQKTAAERAKVMAKFARPIILQAAMFEALKYAGSEAWDWIFGKSDAKKARDKKIDPALDKFIEVVKSPVSSIPGLGPILDTSIEVYKRMALGMPKIDTISNPILSSVEDVALAPAAAIKILNRLKDGKEPRLTDARALARGVDVLSGVPTGNFVEWVSALSSMLMR